MSQASGLLVVDKPTGLTSHQVVAEARRRLGLRRVGHAGTLDPMATGVLLLGVGKATRLLGHLALRDKSYLARIRLGEGTDTDDADGQVTSSASALGVKLDAVERAMSRLRGDISQVPSTYSAIKVAGRRAHDLARRGERVALAARPVRVDEFRLISSARDGDRLDLDVAVTCSTGGYVRALARDLGADLGVGGHLTSLRRTRVGPFRIEAAGPVSAEALIGMADVARACFSCVTLTPEQEADVRHGRPLALALPEAETPSGLIGPGGDLLALYQRVDEGLAKAVAVLV